ncbi:hypothetical protein PG993_003299 [Apiospora rasikravindrae]|uniref:Atos-like C-terminal domain-containing protein n=1 Tax=Apiospora rasikravindrae TaxID=990691 RepID=A0ABR1TZ58_9PEZI
MPIFQEDSEREEESVERPAMASPPSSLGSEAPHSRGRSLARQLSEESIRTELCEGPIPDSPRPTTPEKTSEGEDPTPCTDRAELIERLKRGESPTWIANRHPETRNQLAHSATTPTITPEKRDHGSDDERRLQEGLGIERPRSALHSGDFTQDESSAEARRNRGSILHQNDSAVRDDGHPWLATTPPRGFTPFQYETRPMGVESSKEPRFSSPLSSSLSRSFVYQPPTSPLVQTEVNEDLGLTSPMEGIEIGTRNPRRHTLMSPHSGSYGFPSQGQVARQAPPSRHDRTYPYQAHQPRRSLTSTPNLSITGTSPQTPGLLRSRLPSFSSDTSPLQHASMVGSYEESILRGPNVELTTSAPWGSYRIPEKGQIQIIIKNPNKTAVKLFLVPYDLAGMEAGTKTFIRQRSYSNGPIIDHIPGAGALGAGDRPILRYLVHLHICSPSKGRYYLYKSIRVVFANRVPDGKERLRNEISLPDPKFTAYKPIRVMHPPSSVGIGPGASLAAEKAFRRRSSGFYFGASSHGHDNADGMAGAAMKTIHQDFSLDFASNNAAVEPVSLMFAESPSQSNLGSSQDSHPTTQASSNVTGPGAVDSQISRYNKLKKGDVGYGGNAFSTLINGNPGVAEGLLSQRLRTLGVQAQSRVREQEQQSHSRELGEG